MYESFRLMAVHRSAAHGLSHALFEQGAAPSNSAPPAFVPIKLAARLDRLKQLGVRLAMDDFGTGTSSLGCLRDYPFDIIKRIWNHIQGQPGGNLNMIITGE